MASLAGVGVGVLAFAVSLLLPIGTVCLSAVSIGLGIWGLFGPRPRVATFAVLLGCCGLAWGGFGTAVEIYEMIYGVPPFG